MKIKITTSLIQRRDGETLLSVDHMYSSYEDALKYVLGAHEDGQRFEATYVAFEMEVVE